MDGFIFDCVYRTAKCPNVVLGIPLNICPSNLGGNGVDITCKDFFRAEKARGDGEDSGTGSEVEHNLMGFDPSPERLDGELCRLVRSGSESLSRVDANRQAIAGADAVLPTRYDKEVVAD